MTAEIVELDVVSSLDLPPERVLRKATEAGLTGCVIIGECVDGSEYFASSYADGGVVLWQIERAKLKLLRVADD